MPAIPGCHSTARRLAAVLVVATAASGPAWADTYTTARGGNGGTAFTNAVCASDEVMAGANFRYGNYVDSITPACVKVFPDGTWAGTPTLAPKAGGNGGTTGRNQLCKTDHAVVAILGNASSFVDRLQLVCLKMTEVSSNGVKLQTTPEDRKEAVGGTGGTPFGPDACPSANGFYAAARGFIGRAGSWIDRIQLACHKPTAQTVPALSVALAVTPASPIALGTGFNLEATAQGGTRLKKYDFQVFKTSDPGSPQVASKIGTEYRIWGWRPTQAGTYALRVTAKSAGGSAQQTITGYQVNTTVKFGDYLAAKFQNSKCSNCHGFTANNAKRQEHVTAGRISSTADVTNSANCSNSSCHAVSTGYVDNWHAPPSSMNWQATTAAATICDTINNDARFNTAEEMKGHLKIDAAPNDPFVVWGVAQQNITTTEWNQRVDAWVNGGMLCQ